MHKEQEFENRLAADLRGMSIPQPDAGFENRIVMAALAQQTAKETPVTVHQGSSFTAWWNAPRLAFAAALAAVALVFLVSRGQVTEDRYTVDGVGLLADVDVVEVDVASDETTDEYDIVFASF